MRNQGFFSASELTTQAPQSSIPKCGACGLHKQCRSPKLGVAGGGKRKVLLVGEYPDRHADLHGDVLRGRWWERVRGELKAFGVNLEEDCWVTNALICHPRTPPKLVMADYCRPNLFNTVKELRPNVVILFGELATRGLIGKLWKEDLGKFRKWPGWVIPCQDPNVWVCPTWGREELEDEKYGFLYERQFRQHLAAALDKMNPFGGRPWKTVPDWRTECKTDLHPRHVTLILEEITREGGLVAFDYEADRLKPDPADFTLVSASVCWNGDTTIAFPWQDKEVKKAFRDMLWSSRVRKIAANLKYEERATIKVFGKGVTNWVWDTNIAMHVIDNRPGIVGLKFQAFALLGQDPYEHKVKPYLKPRQKNAGGNAQNRIKEIRTSDLLLYNAMDSLLEYKIAEIQSAHLGVEL